MANRVALLLLACWSPLARGQANEATDRQQDTRAPSAREALPTIIVTAPQLVRDP